MAAIMFISYGISAHYFNLFPFNCSENQLEKFPLRDDGSNLQAALLKPVEMCTIEDVWSNDYQSQLQPRYPLKYWQGIATFTEDEMRAYHDRIEFRYWQLSDGICYGFSAYFLVTPTEQFFDDLHELSYLSSDFTRERPLSGSDEG
jgi:hypothetical protein